MFIKLREVYWVVLLCFWHIFNISLDLDFDIGDMEILELSSISSVSYESDMVI